jgi:hypothetical protein
VQLDDKFMCRCTCLESAEREVPLVWALWQVELEKRRAAAAAASTASAASRQAKRTWAQWMWGAGGAPTAASTAAVDSQLHGGLSDEELAQLQQIVLEHEDAFKTGESLLAGPTMFALLPLYCSLYLSIRLVCALAEGCLLQTRQCRVWYHAGHVCLSVCLSGDFHGRVLH